MVPARDEGATRVRIGGRRIQVSGASEDQSAPGGPYTRVVTDRNKNVELRISSRQSFTKSGETLRNHLIAISHRESINSLFGITIYLFAST